MVQSLCMMVVCDFNINPSSHFKWKLKNILKSMPGSAEIKRAIVLQCNISNADLKSILHRYVSKKNSVAT